LLVEQNARVALETAHYGYVLELGRVVMNDVCERLMHSRDIQNFYLGAKETGARVVNGAGKRENLALNSGLPRKKDRLPKPASEAGEEREGTGMAGPAVLTVADTVARSFLRRRKTRGDGRRSARRSSASGSRPAGGSGCRFQGDRLRPSCGGLPPGDVASIIANAVPEWVYADMGILCAGGVSSASIRPTRRVPRVEF